MEGLRKEKSNGQDRREGESRDSGEERPLVLDDDELVVPIFASTEEAVRWGSHLTAAQHATVLGIQRALSEDALAEHNLQRMVDLATRSQLLREASESFLLSHRKVA